MPEIKKVREFMVPIAEYPVVYEKHSIRIAINTLNRHHAEGKGHRTLLVFKKSPTSNGYEDELVGILTLRDILNAIKRDTMSYQDGELMSIARSLQSYDLKRAFFDDLAKSETTIGDVFKSVSSSSSQAEDHVYKAIDIMLTCNMDLLPVFEGKELVGIIRALDILDYLREKYNKTSEVQIHVAGLAGLTTSRGNLTPL